MIGLNDGLWIGEVGRPRGSLQEEGHVFVEHVLAEYSEPFLGQASLIDTLLILKVDPQGHLPLIRLGRSHDRKRVVKGLFSSHMKLPSAALQLLFVLFEHSAPDKAFGIELEDLRDLDN